MTLCEALLYLADYIEEGRRYPTCVGLRLEFLSELDLAKDVDEAVLALHRAVVKSLNNNIACAYSPAAIGTVWKTPFAMPSTSADLRPNASFPNLGVVHKFLLSIEKFSPLFSIDVHATREAKL